MRKRTILPKHGYDVDHAPVLLATFDGLGPDAPIPTAELDALELLLGADLRNLFSN